MPAIIGALVAALLTAARTYLPGIVGRVLLALGIGFATHQVAMPALVSMLSAQVGALPPLLRAYFGALGLDVVATMILSAHAANAVGRAFLTKTTS